jgi:hypothetical protein
MRQQSENPVEQSDDEANFQRSQLALLIGYRDSYIGDLPVDILLPNDPNYDLYKCRNNFIQSLLNRITLVIKKGVISDPDTLRTLNNYMTELMEIGQHRKKTVDDMRKIDEIIKFLIDLLS